MMTARSLLLAAALLLALPAMAQAQAREETIAVPVLRANVTVESDVVRVGDMVENAGTAAQIAIYRAPDLGTTGSLPTAQVVAVLQAHKVIGVDTRDIKAVSVTRLARTIESKEIESRIAQALEHRKGLGEAANLSLSFDREVQDLRLEASSSGVMQPTLVRYDPRNGRFDITLEIESEVSAARTRLRFTGVAIETAEVAVLTRNVERSEILKSADVVVERRPKAEIVGDAASRGQAVGMQMRKQLRSGQVLKLADLGKPDLVQRDDSVTLIYETTGLYLTMRGKALESGTDGDTVSVLNLQSKRAVSGVVIGRGQVAIAVAAPRLVAGAEATSTLASTLGATETAAPVSVAATTPAQTSSKAE
jgi:flagella basal body P-ring formation protein FlgA